MSSVMEGLKTISSNAFQLVLYQWSLATKASTESFLSLIDAQTVYPPFDTLEWSTFWSGLAAASWQDLVFSGLSGSVETNQEQ